MKKRHHKGRRALSARHRPFGRRLAAAPQGAAPGQPTPEQIYALMAQDIHGLLSALMGAFQVTDTPERLNQLLDLLVREQLVVRDELMPSMTDPARFQNQDRIGLQIWPRDHKEQAIMLLVYKRWEKAKESPQQIFNLAGFFAFLLSPAVRGMVRLAGYDYMFVEPRTKTPEPEKPKIVLVGG